MSTGAARVSLVLLSVLLVMAGSGCRSDTSQAGAAPREQKLPPPGDEQQPPPRDVEQSSPVSAAAQPAPLDLGGRLAFVQGKCVVVRELVTGEETVLALKEEPLAPTFASRERVVFYTSEGIHAWVVGSRASTVVLPKPHIVALGLERKSGALVYMVDETPPSGDPNFPADPSLFGVYALKAAGEASVQWLKLDYGIADTGQPTRIPLSRDGTIMAVPRFPMDVSWHYYLYERSGGKWRPKSVRPEVDPDGTPEYRARLRGAFGDGWVDFGERTAYAFIQSLHDSPHGVYAYPLDDLAGRPRLLGDLGGAGLRGGALSETLRVAAVSVTREGPTPDDLLLCDLTTGTHDVLGEGHDPDIWPR